MTTINPTIHNYRLIDVVHTRTIKERSQVQILPMYIYIVILFFRSKVIEIQSQDSHFGKVPATSSFDTIFTGEAIPRRGNVNKRG
jgi:hypothetical protein